MSKTTRKDGLTVNDITRALCDRDGLTPQEASDTYEEALRVFIDDYNNGKVDFDYCQTWFGLEPDFMDTMLADVGAL